MSSCFSGASFEETRAAEARLLGPIEEHCKDRGSLRTRDVLVKVMDDPVVSHGIIHCIELVPGNGGAAALPVQQQYEEEEEQEQDDDGDDEDVEDEDAISICVEGWPGDAVGLVDVSTTNQTLPPLVLLPGFGMGAASFAPCIENLFALFPERRTYILDWPSTGASVRMPWTLSDKAECSDGVSAEASLDPKLPVRNGVVYVPEEYQEFTDQEKKLNQFCQYPLPEKRFIAMLEEWRKRMGISQMILAGHSIGGYIAFNYAEAYPHSIARLILCSPCGVPRRPDAVGISEVEYREWKRRKDEEEPELANEFVSRSGIKWPQFTCCDRLLMCAACLTGAVLSPLLCLGAIGRWLKRRCCGSEYHSYSETFPQNGSSRDFKCDWAQLKDISSEDRVRMYEIKASPPSTYLRRLPSFLGRRGMRMFAEMRFSDNGQWEESTCDAPNGDPCIVVSGHPSVVAGSSACEDTFKISRQDFSEYQYCVSTLGRAEHNWGDHLYSAVQFHMSYFSYGWCRRPIGHRLEQFVGLPSNIEGGSEFYQEGNTIRIRPSRVDSSEIRFSRGSKGTEQIPVSFFYGMNDWMPFRAAKLISEKAARHTGRNIPVLLLKHSGHQMFVENPCGFVQGLRMLAQ